MKIYIVAHSSVYNEREITWATTNLSDAMYFYNNAYLHFGENAKIFCGNETFVTMIDFDEECGLVLLLPNKDWKDVTKIVRFLK